MKIRGKHHAPEKVYVLVDNIAFDDDTGYRFKDGKRIITVNELATYSIDTGMPIIVYRVSTSKAVLKSYLRSNTHKYRGIKE
jgi:hypothetical protein